MPDFAPRGPWWGGDLQTIRNALVTRFRAPDVGSGERIWLELKDGTHDSLAASLHRPAGDAGAPLVVLIHGLTGCEESTYMRVSTRYHLGRGHPVLRLNLRGAGPSGQRCEQLYHAGRSEDLRRALAALDPALTARGVFVVGYSLGGNMLAKYLAEVGRRGPVIGAATVSAPLDLHATSRRFHEPRNLIYHRWLLGHMKVECLKPGATLTTAERHAVQSATTIYQFDERFTAPRNGFRGADDYYSRSSAARLIGDIAIPTLMIHANDDPWIPPYAYQDARQRATPQLEVELVRGGGHVGFHGRGDAVPWHDRRIGAFFDRIRP